MNTGITPEVESELRAARALLDGGNPAEAVPRYERALQIDPEFFVGRLHYARALELCDRHEAALAHYYRAINQAQMQGRWRNAETTAPIVRELVVYAMRYVDAGRRRLFDGVLAPFRERAADEAMRRVEKCLAIYLGEQAPAYADARQKPKFLYFPDLPATTYFARDRFPWYAQLESQTDVIRAEMRAALRAQQGIEPFLKFGSPEEASRYLGGGAQGAPAWDAIFFYRHGKRYDDNCARCPRTAAILDALPLVRVPRYAPEVCFSVLTPGTHILPHRGSTNTRLVTHLPLVVPENCALTVGGEVHCWQEGCCVTFDDTFEHEAWNRGGSLRVVMLLDVWNPHLTPIERDAVSALLGAIRDFNTAAGIALD